MERRVRDDGAGHCKTGTLYAHGDVVSDMLAELDEIRDRVSDAEMAGIVEVMSETLFKATQRARQRVHLSRGVASDLQGARVLRGSGGPRFGEAAGGVVWRQEGAASCGHQPGSGAGSCRWEREAPTLRLKRIEVVSVDCESNR